MRCSTPKRCCSSITASARSLKATSSENSAWVPTTMPISPEARRSRMFVARAALFPTGQQGDLDPRRLRQLDQRRVMLAGQDFRRRHQRRLAAGLDHVEHRDQRHHRLAAADIALEKAQHAVAAPPCRRRSRRSPGAAIGQGKGQGSFITLSRRLPGTLMARPAGAAYARAAAGSRADWPAARHRRGGLAEVWSATVGLALRRMRGDQRRFPVRPLALFFQRRVDPFRQFRRLRQRGGDPFCTVRSGRPAVRP